MSQIKLAVQERTVRTRSQSPRARRRLFANEHWQKLFANEPRADLKTILLRSFSRAFAAFAYPARIILGLKRER